MQKRILILILMLAGLNMHQSSAALPCVVKKLYRDIDKEAIALIKAKDLQSFKQLLDEGCLGIDDPIDNENNTLLLKAIENGANDIAALLINRGADIKKINSSNNSPLLLAAHLGNTPIVILLLKAGADPNAIQRLYPYSYAIYSDYPQPINALTLAAEANSTDSVIELLKHKANPNLLYPNMYTTPLMMAAHNNNQKMIEALLAHGAKKDAQIDRRNAADYLPSNASSAIKKLLGPTTAQIRHEKQLNDLKNTPPHRLNPEKFNEWCNAHNVAANGIICQAIKELYLTGKMTPDSRKKIAANPKLVASILKVVPTGEGRKDLIAELYLEGHRTRNKELVLYLENHAKIATDQKK